MNLPNNSLRLICKYLNITKISKKKKSELIDSIINNNEIHNYDNDNRVATNTMNGFLYQRYSSMLIFLKNCESHEYFLEESNEDIDIININHKTKTVIQIKYHGISSEKESLDNNSGLIKVIKSKNNIKDVDMIDNIKYISYVNCNDNEMYNDSLKQSFEKNNHENIRKYLLLLLSKQSNNDNNIINEDSKITINLLIPSNELLLNELYNKKLNCIKNLECYNVFNTEFCKKYFNKFDLCNGYCYDELISEIKKEITVQYKNFVDSNNPTYSEMKINLLFNELFMMFDKSMFKYPENNKKGADNRKLSACNIKIKFNELIEIFTDKDNLEHEYIKSCIKYINTYDNEMELTNKINQIITMNKLSNEIYYEHIMAIELCKFINKDDIHDTCDKSYIELYSQIQKIIVNNVYDIINFSRYDNYDDKKKLFDKMGMCTRNKKNKKKFRNFPMTYIDDLYVSAGMKTQIDTKKSINESNSDVQHIETNNELSDNYEEYIKNLIDEADNGLINDKLIITKKNKKVRRKTQDDELFDSD
jgi:hypothetical protein